MNTNESYHLDFVEWLFLTIFPPNVLWAGQLWERFPSQNVNQDNGGGQWESEKVFSLSFFHFHLQRMSIKSMWESVLTFTFTFSLAKNAKMKVKKSLRWHHFHLRFSLSQDYLTTWNERYSVGIARVTMIYLKWQQERLLSPSSYQSIKLFFQSFRTFFKRGEFWFILNCNILNFRKENVPVSPGGEFTYTQLPQLTWINMIQGQHSQAWTCQVPHPLASEPDQAWTKLM